MSENPADTNPTPPNAESADDAFIRNFGKAQSALLAFLVSTTFNHADADDLLQEVNLALWRKRASYDPNQDFLRWAIGFAKTEVLNHRSKQAKSRLVLSDEAVQALAIDWPCDMGRHQQRLEALALCVNKLGDLENHLLGDLYGRGRSVRDFAETHSMPQSTVYKVLDRVRRALRQCVERAVAHTGHPA